MDESTRAFSPEELAEFSKDCMALALEALERGDTETAKVWIRKQEETKRGVVHAPHRTRHCT